MEAQKLAPKSIVWMEWLDSASLHGWSLGTPKLEYGKILTAGIVVSCTKEQLTVSLAMNDEGSVLCPLAVPWPAISAVRELH